MSGIFFTHFPTGGYRAPAEAHIFSEFVVPGVPDLLICETAAATPWNSSSTLAARTAHLSPSQIETQRLMKEAEGIIGTGLKGSQRAYRVGSTQ